jgi:hypothetical protein
MYRNETAVSSQVEQQKRRFLSIAERVIEPGTIDEDWPQHLISCVNPWRCAYHGICHDPQPTELTGVPEGFEARVAHHEFERERGGK